MPRSILAAIPAIFTILLLSVLPVSSQKNENDPSRLLGNWQIDLRPVPDADPYYREFVVDSIEGKTITGTFYGTEFENGRINTDWGYVYFAFTTRDGSGIYNHSGVLKDGKLQGLSHSIGREFLSVWSASKSEVKEGDSD